MNDALLEKLLYEEESTALDFKKEQYSFVRATDEEKSELLKDILGIANAWRRTEAYILIGVEDVRGGRSSVVGISAADHLNDHSLQQFVNNLTNRPIQFHYEAFGFEGKQVGIIRLDEKQDRPLYLKKDYGKLRRGEVYVRRGSSTDPQKPADPDEIARMGREISAEPIQPSLLVEFADPGRELALGCEIEWRGELCETPNPDDIPELEGSNKTGWQLSVTEMIVNKDYYFELAEFVHFRKLAQKLRLVITNAGSISAADVRLEISVPNDQKIIIVDDSNVPSAPKKRTSRINFPVGMIAKQRLIRPPGDVNIEKDGDQTKLDIECGTVQPGRKIWSDAFFVGITKSGKQAISGKLFATNLRKPIDFSLSFDAIIGMSTMTVDQLIELSKPGN